MRSLADGRISRAHRLRSRHRLTVGAAAVFVLGLALTAESPAAIAGPAFVDWPSYLGGPPHSSYSAATAIDTVRAQNLSSLWTIHPKRQSVHGEPAPGFTASPTVFGGTVYIGDNTGLFYAVDETNGHVRWKQFLGFVTEKTCAPRGIASTAAVAVDPVSGTPTVYVAGGDGYLYALDAGTGAIVWKSVIAIPSQTANDYYDWSSPAVFNGRVYIGVSSQCDKPLVAGAGLQAHDQETGAVVATYTSMPPGVVGGSVWTSPAVDASGDVFVDTGNAAKRGSVPGDSSSLMRLDGRTLAREGSWRLPNGQVEDDDWSASPTIFRATVDGTPTEMVGACNKLGIFYAFQADNIGAGPLWTFQIGAATGNGALSCLGSAIWDAAHSELYVPGNATTIGGTAYNGSVRALNPDNGHPIWERGLPALVLGSPSLDASGVIAAATYFPGTTSGTYLINAANGAILSVVPVGREFAQPVFADSYLFLANARGDLSAFPG